MPSRIVISAKIEDARGEVAKSNFESLGLRGKIRSVRIADSYLLDGPYSLSELKKIGSALANPLIEDYKISDTQLKKKFDWLIEVGFLPGVTDNIGTTALETTSDLLRKKTNSSHIYSSKVYFITGKLTPEEVKLVAYSLHNPLIQLVNIKNYRQFVREHGLGRRVPKVELKPKKLVTTINLNVPDNELEAIGKLGIANADGSRRGPLTLSLAYMKAIQAHFAKIG